MGQKHPVVSPFRPKSMDFAICVPKLYKELRFFAKISFFSSFILQYHSNIVTMT